MFYCCFTKRFLYAEAAADAHRDMGKIDSAEGLRNIDKSLIQRVISYYCDIVENKCLYHSADGSDTDSAKELGRLIDGIINNNNINAVETYQDVEAIDLVS